MGWRSRGTELDRKTHGRVRKLSKEGDVLAGNGSYADAIARYGEALDLLPEPREDRNATTWLLASIGDAAFLAGAMEQARAALEDAMHCPGGLGNPFLHLRLGEVQLELGHPAAAADELMRAYLGGGVEIFARENPKYLAFLRQQATLPG